MNWVSKLVDGPLELRQHARPRFDPPPVARRFSRPKNKVCNAHIYAATDAGISRSTSINLAELIS
jgi:hypothetical protein